MPPSGAETSVLRNTIVTESVNNVLPLSTPGMQIHESNGNYIRYSTTLEIDKRELSTIITPGSWHVKQTDKPHLKTGNLG